MSARAANTWHGRLDRLLRRREHGAVKALAAKLGTDPSQVSHYRAGRRLPDVVELITICREFEVSADWLLGLDEGGAPGPERIEDALAKLDEARKLLSQEVDDVARRARALKERAKGSTRQRGVG